MNTIKVTGIQFPCVESKKKNLDKAGKLIEVAAGRGADIICLPELFATRWFPRETDPGNFKLAEESSGETVSVMRELANRWKAVIVAPFFEKSADGSYFNSAAVIDECGLQ